MMGKQVVLQEYCKKKTETFNSDINSKKEKKNKRPTVDNAQQSSRTDQNYYNAS